MSIRFSGGDKFQRGRGIGGILRLAKSLFKPMIRTVGKAVISNTGKAIGNAIKEQVKESGTNLAVDALRGNNLRDGINREVNAFKQHGAKGIEHLQKGRKVKRKFNYIDVTPKKVNKQKKCQWNYGEIL